MILIINAENRRFAIELADMHRQRKILFVDRAGWRLPVHGDVEVDAHDHEHATYLITQMDAGSTQVLGAHCDGFHLNLSQAIRIHPGERGQIPHRDEEMWPCRKGRNEYLVNVMWVASYFTPHKDATLSWPRSQFAVPTRQTDAAHAHCACMPRGSALIYLGSVTHCAGANHSEAPRRELIFSDSLGWQKQYENAFLAYPLRVANQFSKPVGDLLGYRIHRPNLRGYEGQDQQCCSVPSRVRCRRAMRWRRKQQRNYAGTTHRGGVMQGIGRG